jgi:hypothetical protein
MTGKVVAAFVIACRKDLSIKLRLFIWTEFKMGIGSCPKKRK